MYVITEAAMIICYLEFSLDNCTLSNAQDVHYVTRS